MQGFRLLLRILGRIIIILPIVIFLTQPFQQVETAVRSGYEETRNFLTTHGLKLLNSLERADGNMEIAVQALRCFGGLLCLMFVLSDIKATFILIFCQIVWNIKENDGKCNWFQLIGIAGLGLLLLNRRDRVENLNNFEEPTSNNQNR